MSKTLYSYSLNVDDEQQRGMDASLDKLGWGGEVYILGKIYII